MAKVVQKPWVPGMLGRGVLIPSGIKPKQSSPATPKTEPAKKK